MKVRFFFMLSGLGLILLATGCGSAGKSEAIATLEAKNNSGVSGSVRFVDLGKQGTQVIADIAGLTPGKHGFHLHAVGDCSSPDGKSAGGHWNPHNVMHGAPTAHVHHTGDLGNLTADAAGRARLDVISKDFHVAHEPSVVNRAVIVHAQPDDLTSQPTGAAGARVACGVIKKK